MSLFRLLLAWLVLAALPLQGFAAASMLHCATDSGPPSATAQRAASGHHHGVADSFHGHAPEYSPSAEAQKTGTGSKSLPAGTHPCGVCASCCNSAAIADSAQPMAFTPLGQAELSVAPVRVESPPTPVPDKPPRG